MGDLIDMKEYRDRSLKNSELSFDKFVEKIMRDVSREVSLTMWLLDPLKNDEDRED
ncbi:MAG: hypothetical protein IH612_10950 [Desulfofustis sp.]|nr:hypothetical protein [Desulfofustis sp.]